MCGVWCVLCVVWCVVCGVWCAVCAMRHQRYGMHVCVRGACRKVRHLLRLLSRTRRGPSTHARQRART
jgi:hypothetical protein